MGMFDTIIYDKMDCSRCGAPLGEYQSKSGNCELQSLTLRELLAQSDEPEPIFYGYCHSDDWNGPHEHHYNEFKVIPPRPLQVVRTGVEDD